MAYLEPVTGGWKVRWREGGRGSPLLASPVFDNETKAQDFADDIAGRIGSRRALSRSRAYGAPLQLVEVAHRWGAARVAAKGIAPAHAENVARLVRELAKRMGWSTVADVTPAEIERWRTENGGRNARLGAYLRSVLRWADERLRQPVPEGTWIALRPPRGRRRGRAALPTAEDVHGWQAKADAVSENAGALVHCLSTYGWRPIMAARLAVRDADLQRTIVRHRAIHGEDEDYEHPILAATVKRLRSVVAGRSADAPLFLDPRTGLGWLAEDETGKSNRNAITEWWRANIEARQGSGIYGLKRLAISSMLDRGISPQDVALFTGHRSLSQVLVYARTNEDRARAALDALGGSSSGARRVHRGRRQATRRDEQSA